MVCVGQSYLEKYPSCEFLDQWEPKKDCLQLLTNGVFELCLDESLPFKNEIKTFHPVINFAVYNKNIYILEKNKQSWSWFLYLICPLTQDRGKCKAYWVPLSAKSSESEIGRATNGICVFRPVIIY